MILQDIMVVQSHKKLAHNIFELKLTGKLVKEINSPGQLVHVRGSDSYDMLLRRPIASASIREEATEITLLSRT